MSPEAGEPAPVAAVLDAARASGLLDPDAGALVLLSGGRDSVCALDVCRCLVGPRRTRALHVNYRLRPEADAEEGRLKSVRFQENAAEAISRGVKDFVDARRRLARAP